MLVDLSDEESDDFFIGNKNSPKISSSTSQNNSFQMYSNNQNEKNSNSMQEEKKEFSFLVGDEELVQIPQNDQFQIENNNDIDQKNPSNFVSDFKNSGSGSLNFQKDIFSHQEQTTDSLSKHQKSETETKNQSFSNIIQFPDTFQDQKSSSFQNSNMIPKENKSMIKNAIQFPFTLPEEKDHQMTKNIQFPKTLPDEIESKTSENEFFDSSLNEKQPQKNNLIQFPPIFQDDKPTKNKIQFPQTFPDEIQTNDYENHQEISFLKSKEDKNVNTKSPENSKQIHFPDTFKDIDNNSKKNKGSLTQTFLENANNTLFELNDSNEQFSNPNFTIQDDTEKIESKSNNFELPSDLMPSAFLGRKKQNDDIFDDFVSEESSRIQSPQIKPKSENVNSVKEPEKKYSSTSDDHNSDHQHQISPQKENKDVHFINTQKNQQQRGQIEKREKGKQPIQNKGKVSPSCSILNNSKINETKVNDSQKTNIKTKVLNNKEQYEKRKQLNTSNFHQNSPNQRKGILESTIHGEILKNIDNFPLEKEPSDISIDDDFVDDESNLNSSRSLESKSKPSVKFGRILKKEDRNNNESEPLLITQTSKVYALMPEKFKPPKLPPPVSDIPPGLNFSLSDEITIEAMKNCGYIEEDLKYPSQAELNSYSRDESIKNKIKEELQKDVDCRVAEVSNERDKIITERQNNAYQSQLNEFKKTKKSISELAYSKSSPINDSASIRSDKTFFSEKSPRNKDEERIFIKQKREAEKLIFQILKAKKLAEQQQKQEDLEKARQKAKEQERKLKQKEAKEKIQRQKEEIAKKEKQREEEIKENQRLEAQKQELIELRLQELQIQKNLDAQEKDKKRQERIINARKVIEKVEREREKKLMEQQEKEQERELARIQTFAEQQQQIREYYQARMKRNEAIRLEIEKKQKKEQKFNLKQLLDKEKKAKEILIASEAAKKAAINEQKERMKEKETSVIQARLEIEKHNQLVRENILLKEQLFEERRAKIEAEKKAAAIAARIGRSEVTMKMAQKRKQMLEIEQLKNFERERISKEREEKEQLNQDRLAKERAEEIAMSRLKVAQKQFERLKKKRLDDRNAQIKFKEYAEKEEKERQEKISEEIEAQKRRKQREIANRQTQELQEQLNMSLSKNANEQTLQDVANYYGINIDEIKKLMDRFETSSQNEIPNQ